MENNTGNWNKLFLETTATRARKHGWDDTDRTSKQMGRNSVLCPSCLRPHLAPLTGRAWQADRWQRGDGVCRVPVPASEGTVQKTGPELSGYGLASRLMWQCTKEGAVVLSEHRKKGSRIDIANTERRQAMEYTLVWKIFKPEIGPMGAGEGTGGQGQYSHLAQASR